MTRAIVLRGDAAHLPLPDASVDLIVTSPPYWSLRSYTDGGQHYAGQIGSEATPAEYIDALLQCTREWVRVLKRDGSMFIDLGDKYSDRGHGPSRGNGTGRGPQGTSLKQTRGPLEKSLLLLPERYRIACVDELGLIARAVITWSKPNGLPESVTDRVRRSHEDIVHFTRQPRYYSAVDEVREAHQPQSIARTGRRYLAGDSFSVSTPNTLDPAQFCNPLGKLPGSVWSIPSSPLTVPAHLGVDHFAAYPPELVRRIVLGWSPAAVCTACGQGRRPVVSKALQVRQRHLTDRQDGNGDNQWGTSWRVLGGATEATITGYACACPDATAPATPGTVLDPFGGTGTTALVASVHGRTGISVDRSADYCRLTSWRVSDPAERARAMHVPKPPPVPEGQASLFDDAEVGA